MPATLGHRLPANAGMNRSPPCRRRGGSSRMAYRRCRRASSSHRQGRTATRRCRRRRSPNHRSDLTGPHASSPRHTRSPGPASCAIAGADHRPTMSQPHRGRPDMTVVTSPRPHGRASSPRIRGTGSLAHRQDLTNVSSPRVRGTVRSLHGSADINRVIPACAGNRQHCGSRSRTLTGVIPACAGNRLCELSTTVPAGSRIRGLDPIARRA